MGLASQGQICLRVTIPLISGVCLSRFGLKGFCYGGYIYLFNLRERQHSSSLLEAESDPAF